MRHCLFAALALSAGACAHGPLPQVQLGAEEATKLTRAIEGKVPGAPMSCIPGYDGSKLHSIGDNVLVYRAGRDLVYVNRLQGSCTGLARGDAMVLNRMSSQYCRGDIARVVNMQSGMMTGSCALGDFVPYRPPAK